MGTRCKDDIYLSSLQIKIEEINLKWKGTIILGVVGSPLSSSHFPSSAILLRRPCWIFTHDHINIDGCRTQSKVAECLVKIQKDTVLTMSLSHSGGLSIRMGDKLIEGIATGLPHHIYPVFDLYGKCEKISLINTDTFMRNGTPINEGALMSTMNQMSLEAVRNVPQCEKAVLEVHEKETEAVLPPVRAEGSSGSSVMYVH